MSISRAWVNIESELPRHEWRGSSPPIMRDNINDYAERHLLEPKIVVVPSVSDAECDGMPKSCQSSRVVATDNI